MTAVKVHSRHNVEIGNPPDAPMLVPAVARIAERAHKMPRAVTADRGYGEIAVEDTLQALGVRTVVLPRKGRPTFAPSNTRDKPGLTTPPSSSGRSS
jgi:IS5 family transposase